MWLDKDVKIQIIESGGGFGEETCNSVARAEKEELEKETQDIVAEEQREVMPSQNLHYCTNTESLIRCTPVHPRPLII